MLQLLPLSLQQCVLLEWLSPETVWTLVRLSGTLRRRAQTSPQAFRAANKEILSDACVRWFQERGPRLVLFEETRVHHGTWSEHLCNGKHHSVDDKPAVNCYGSYQMWRQHGMLHRDNDLPAYIGANGTQSWYQHGKRHRDGDLPAVIGADGTKIWYQHGKRHREGGKAAFIHHSGVQVWSLNGVCVPKPRPKKQNRKVR